MEGVQLRMPKDSKYYLPDVMLSCAPEGEDEYIEENPCVLVEVVSPTSVIRDYNEKKLEYFTRPPAKVASRRVTHLLLLVPLGQKQEAGRSVRCDR